MTSVDLNNLSIEELKKIKKDKQHKLKKEFNDYKQHQKKQKLIADIIVIDKQRKKNSNAKSNPKPKPKIKSFEEYFQECIKNKTIPDDTSPYLKKALERAPKKSINKESRKRNQL